jgi:flavin-dependent dehydrogenase
VRHVAPTTQSDLAGGDWDSDWDVVVIGAGPAGALAAHQLAAVGARTLVVDVKRFPRAKVCGGCLNRRGIAALHNAGLASLLDDCGATSVHSLHWIVGSQRARFALPEMRVVDRGRFDEALVRAAIRAGATFLDGTQAWVAAELVDERRSVALKRGSEHGEISARLVIAADGLSRSSVKRVREFRSQVMPHSRIGVGATLPLASSLSPDELTMVVGRHGYVGLVSSGTDRITIAAAMDPGAVAGATVDRVVGEMLAGAGIQLPAGQPPIAWHGTPPLTSRPHCVAAERLFLIGDASGYVEPFSGEGMAAALESALAVAPLAREAIDNWRPSLVAEWESVQRTVVVESQATCRQLAWILRHGWVAAAAIGLCRAQPWIARSFIRKVS